MRAPGPSFATCLGSSSSSLSSRHASPLGFSCHASLLIMVATLSFPAALSQTPHRNTISFILPVTCQLYFSCHNTGCASSKSMSGTLHSSSAKLHLSNFTCYIRSRGNFSHNQMAVFTLPHHILRKLAQCVKKKSAFNDLN